MRLNSLTTVPVLLTATALAVVATASAHVRTASGPAVLRASFNKALTTSILVDGRGRTLYVFASDTRGKPECVGDLPFGGCGKTWPGFTATGRPTAGPGVRASLIGRLKRSDGRVQVSYKRHPLYFFAGYPPTPGDRKPGDVNGQTFGSQWYVLSPSGAVVKTRPKLNG